MKKRFHVSPAVLDLGVRVRGAFAYGMDNANPAPELDLWLAAIRARVMESLAPETLMADSVLEGFRALHAKLGKTGKRWLSSPENMLGNALRFGRIPSISPVVDIYNAISLETRLALGAHDLAHVEGDIALRLCDGAEYFMPLGAREPERVQAGEYAYCDEAGDVLCRMEVRQVEKTRVTPATRDAFFIIQGHEGVTDAVLDAAVDTLGAAVLRFCGGDFERAS